MPTDLARRVAYQRRIARMTQQELADAAGVHVGTYGRSSAAPGAPATTWLRPRCRSRSRSVPLAGKPGPSRRPCARRHADFVGCDRRVRRTGRWAGPPTGRAANSGGRGGDVAPGCPVRPDRPSSAEAPRRADPRLPPHPRPGVRPSLGSTPTPPPRGNHRANRSPPWSWPTPASPPDTAKRWVTPRASPPGPRRSPPQDAPPQRRTGHRRRPVPADRRPHRHRQDPPGIRLHPHPARRRSPAALGSRHRRRPVRPPAPPLRPRRRPGVSAGSANATSPVPTPRQPGLKAPPDSPSFRTIRQQPFRHDPQPPCQGHLVGDDQPGVGAAHPPHA